MDAALARAAVVIGSVSRVARALAGAVLVAVTAYILVEIALRLAGRATNVVVELVGYALAGMTFLAASATMRDGGMVRVGLVLSRVSPRVHRLLDGFCLLCGIATIGLATVFVGRDMLQSYERGYETDSLLALPLWLPPLPMLLGLVTFLLDMLLHLVLVARGDVMLSDESPDVI